MGYCATVLPRQGLKIYFRFDVHGQFPPAEQIQGVFLDDTVFDSLIENSA
jgi:hypothetical protein